MTDKGVPIGKRYRIVTNHQGDGTPNPCSIQSMRLHM